MQSQIQRGKGATDLPAKQDRFGIEKYISGLCRFIVGCPTPMTIAIQGDWGSGKTSVMQMVEKKLDALAKQQGQANKATIQCVWLNTWQFSQFNTEDNLSLSLLTALIDGLKIEHSNSAKTVLADIGRIALGLAKRIGYIVADNTIGGTNAGDLRDALDKPHTETRSVNEIIRDLKENFQKCVCDALAGEGGIDNEEDRVVIFIDDLDRVPPVRAVEILEVFKNFIDCEKCVFVLAIDYNVVVSGVKGKYGADIDESKGRNFFDKIIQVPFRMPMAQYDISNFIKETLEEAAGIKCSDEETKEYIALISTSTGSNPRSMKRLFNSFLLQKMVVGDDLLKTGRDEKILFALLCMQQRFGNLYDYIVLNKDEDISDIFSRLAASEAPESVLEALSGLETQGEEPSEIQAFVRKFNLVLTSGANQTGQKSETDVSTEQWNSIKPLLEISAVTATETVVRSVKTRLSFVYKGETYKSRGKDGRNLSFLALRLINDYAKEKAQGSAEWINRVNDEIPLHSPNSKYAGLDSIIERSNYLLSQDDNIQRYHHAEKQIVRLEGKEYLVATEWAQEWVETLIDILGYTEQVNR